jgi:PGM1 C-terminal domain
VADTGLASNPETKTGVVLHMLSCLAIDGRFGLTAIANSPDQARALHEATQKAVDENARARYAQSRHTGDRPHSADAGSSGLAVVGSLRS